MNTFELSHKWFSFSFENPDKVTPTHTAIYFFAIEVCNKLGWKEKFGFPSSHCMDALGIKKHNTYSKHFKDLVEWGFIELIQESKNQYTANIISLKFGMLKNDKAEYKALDKATAKQVDEQSKSTVQSKGSIDKQITNNLTTIDIPPSAIHIKKVVEDNLDIVSINLEKWVADYKEEIDAIGTHWINQFIVENKCKRIRRMATQMDYKTMCNIEKKYKKEFIEQELLAMENWKDTITKNTNVGLTLQNWLNRKGEAALNIEYSKHEALRKYNEGYSENMHG
jgi:hypothetical protein